MSSMQTSTETTRHQRPRRGSQQQGGEQPPPTQGQGKPRASLMEVMRAEQALQLKQLEAQQEYQEQKNLMESAQRELEAAKAALQRVQQTNAADWAVRACTRKRGQ